MSVRAQQGDEKEDQSYQFGNTGSAKIEGAAATGSAVGVMAVNCVSFTGKKAFLISQTTAVAGAVAYVTYGSYDPDLTREEFITLMEAADTEKIFALDETGAAGTVDSGGTQQARFSVTDPWKWMGVTVSGSTFTYNLYFSGS